MKALLDHHHQEEKSSNLFGPRELVRKGYWLTVYIRQSAQKQSDLSNFCHKAGNKPAVVTFFTHAPPEYLSQYDYCLIGQIHEIMCSTSCAEHTHDQG